MLFHLWIHTIIMHAFGAQQSHLTMPCVVVRQLSQASQRCSTWCSVCFYPRKASFHVCSACCMVYADVNFTNGGDGDGISSVAASHEIHLHSSIIMLKFKMCTNALLSKGSEHLKIFALFAIRFAVFQKFVVLGSKSLVTVNARIILIMIEWKRKRAYIVTLI